MALKRDLPCCIEGCDRLVGIKGARGMCGMHYQRWYVHGDPAVVKVGGGNAPARSASYRWTGDSASYKAVHRRLASERGPASAQVCIDCGGPARQWSYDNADPNERQCPRFGRYSTDLGHYSPRCSSCHKRFDLRTNLLKEAGY